MAVCHRVNKKYQIIKKIYISEKLISCQRNFDLNNRKNGIWNTDTILYYLY